jgi:enoyl-CoA hydratase
LKASRPFARSGDLILRVPELSAFKTLIYEKQGSIARVTLNRPDFLNTYNVQMRDDFSEVLTAIRDDDEVRAVMFAGAGEKAFCAGADLKEFLTAPAPVAARRIRFERDVWRLFLSMPQPLIAVLHGYVLGSGIEMALCCDIRIAADSALFGLPEVSLGILPAAGGTQTLPRIVGRGHALEMLLGGEWVEADRALQINLINRVVPGGELTLAARAVAEKIATYDPEVVRSAKRAVVQGLELTLSDGLTLEKMLALQLACRR